METGKAALLLNSLSTQLRRIVKREEPSSENQPLEGQPRLVQKKAVLFRTLSILWIIPTLTSMFVFFYRFPLGGSFLEMIRQVRVEQWIALLLILLHGVFLYLASHYRKTEVPSEIWEDDGASGSSGGPV